MKKPVLPPLGLYIHIPWCLKKCPYCDFNSHAIEGDLPEAEYCEQLTKDMTLDLPLVQGRQLDSIFIGGGTPSLFSPDNIGELLEKVSAGIPFAPDIEITLEANPGTFEIEKFSRFREAGINRLSIGIQSFNQQKLSALGRVHSDQEALNAAANASNAGFDNYNLDLMFGLPGQTMQQVLDDLEAAQSFHPTHLSWYQLTLEPNTLFYSKPPALPDDDFIAELQEKGIALLEKNGFNRYEVSAFSIPGKNSVHNMNYWQFGDYLGIGAGAHGKITLSEERKIIRTRKTRQPSSYLKQQDSFTAEFKEINESDLPLEFLMNALRLCAGCDTNLFEERTGLSVNRIQAQINSLRNKGLLQEERLAATDRGFLFLNSLLQEFLPSVHQDKDLIPVHSR